MANADGILNRIDNIVIRLDIPNRQVTAEIVQGNFSENAVAPALTRGTSVYDLRIAKISIPAGTTAITQDLITDCRFDSNDCGNVICAVQSPDFTDILSQYEALWNSLISKKNESFNNWFNGKTEDFDDWFKEKTTNFNDWFNKMKDQLTEDAAGNLQAEIDEIKQTQQDTLHEIFIGKKEDAPESAKLIIEDEEVEEEEDEGEVYSTEEQVVGTWIDGKPIYRKCFTGALSQTERSVFIDNTNNKDKLISTKGFIFSNVNEKVFFEIGKSALNDRNTNLTAQLTRVIIVNNFIRLDYAEGLNQCSYEIAVEYTKTTD